MSLWDDFSDKISRGFDQLNPFDNGKDWNNRVGNPIKKKKDEPVAPGVVIKPNVTLPAFNTPKVAAPNFQTQPVTPQVQRPGVSTDLQVPSTVAPKPVQAPVTNRIAKDGTITDTRPFPARVPGDDFSKANRILKYAGNTKGIDETEQLRQELQKPVADKARIQALTQAVKNKKIQADEAEVNKMRVDGINNAYNPINIAGDIAKTFVAEPIKAIGDNIGGLIYNTSQAQKKKDMDKKAGVDGYANPLLVKSQRDEIDRAEKAKEITPERAKQLRAETDQKEKKAKEAKAKTDADFREINGGKDAKTQDELVTGGDSPDGTLLQAAVDIGTLGMGKTIVNGVEQGGKILKKSIEDLVTGKETKEIVKKIDDLIPSAADNAEKGVIQIVNREKGTKEYIKPGDAEYNAAKKQIDDSRVANGDDNNGIAGTPQENGDIYHITARTPEQMEARGFTARNSVQQKADDLVESTDAMSVSDAYKNAQTARAAERTSPLIDKVKNASGEELYDPRLVQQRLDNEEFKRLKKAGKTFKGQRELTPEQSLAVQRGQIENPQSMVKIRVEAPQQVGEKNYTVKDIIKHYGKEDGERARDFENYRIFKDELDRINKGANNTIGVDEKAMADFVTQYELKNPIAIEHNAALRKFSLDLLAAKRDARIDAPEVFDKSSQFDFYNPRKALDPDELIRPNMNGGIRSGAKVTKGRAETSGGLVRSPLSVFLKEATDAEKSLAEQRFGNIIRERTLQGNIKGAREVINAETVVAHKNALREMRDLSDTIKSLQVVKKGAKQEFNTAQTVEKAKLDAVNAVKTYLSKAGENDVMADLVPYANTISDQEAYNLFKVLTDKSVPNTTGIANRIAKDTGATPDDVKDFINGLRGEISETRKLRVTAGQTASVTSQNLERGTQTISYRLDGETGKIEIPIDLARELDRANAAFNASPLEQMVRPIGSFQKLTWTGALSPVFQVYNVLLKNPVLAYRNADGLSGVGVSAFTAGLKSFLKTKKSVAFEKEMMKRGATRENALQTKNIQSTVADDIAARANLATFFNRNPVHTMQDVWKGLNVALASGSNAQRTAVEFGAYIRALKANIPEEEALSIASQASAKVYGDFSRVSRLAQNMEVLIPYSGAIQAGARSLARASKTKPLETALKDATIISAIGGFASYSLMNNPEYYNDMIASNKEYELDNNWTIVLPGASKDENGIWSGVIKIPLTPDFRPYNRATWKTIKSMTEGKGVDVGMIAGELFNQFTGDTANSLYSNDKTDDGKNPLNGFLAGSPGINTIKIGSGVDPSTGNPIADPYTKSKNPTEQTDKYTSDGAKNLSVQLGGVVTPQQIDKFLDQMGNFGDTVQDRKSEDGSSELLNNFLNFGKPLAPGKSMTEKAKDGKQYYADLEAVKKGIKDKKVFEQFEALHTKANEDAPENILTNAAKSASFMSADGKGGFSTTPLFEAEKALDKLSRDRGEPGNPIYDLAPQELQKVLEYRSGKVYNAAKQNYTKNGEGAFTSLGLDEKWYSDFQKAESDYFDAVIPDDGKGEDDIKSFSGKSKAKLTPEQTAIEDQYYALPAKSAERKALLAANPFLKDYWAAGNDFTEEERKALGFNSAVEDESGSKYGSGGGSGGGNLLKGSDFGSAGSSYKPNTSVKLTSVKRKARTRAGTSKGKITLKKSKTV